MKKSSRPMAWFLPLALLLPLVGAAAAVLAAWGPKIRDILTIVIKMAVIS